MEESYEELSDIIENELQVTTLGSKVPEQFIILSSRISRSSAVIYYYNGTYLQYMYPISTVIQ